MSTALKAQIKNASYINYVHFSLLYDDFVEIQYPVVLEFGAALTLMLRQNSIIVIIRGVKDPPYNHLIIQSQIVISNVETSLNFMFSLAEGC